MYGHSQKVSQLQAESIASLKLAEEEHRGQEGDLKMDNRTLKCDIKEQQLSNEDKIKDLKLHYESNVFISFKRLINNYKMCLI